MRQLSAKLFPILVIGKFHFKSVHVLCCVLYGLFVSLCMLLLPTLSWILRIYRQLVFLFAFRLVSRSHTTLSMNIQCDFFLLISCIRCCALNHFFLHCCFFHRGMIIYMANYSMQHRKRSFLDREKSSNIDIFVLVVFFCRRYFYL